MLNALLLAITMACTSLVPAEEVVVHRDSEMYGNYPELAEELATLIVEIRADLQLEAWRLNIHFDSMHSAAAMTDAFPSYYIAVIVFDLSNFVDAPNALKLEAVAHELYHVMTWESDTMMLQMAYERRDPELLRQARIMREQLATRLSRNYVARRK
jgi:hypothetical protein